MRPLGELRFPGKTRQFIGRTRAPRRQQRVRVGEGFLESMGLITPYMRGNQGVRRSIMGRQDGLQGLLYCSMTWKLARER
jgi:hypothetical protein